MIEVDVPSSSAIEPRMSVCLKGTTKFLEGDDFSDSEHEDSSLFFMKSDPSEDEFKEISDSRRSTLSATSVLLTGTSCSILRTSLVEDNNRRQEKSKLQKKGVRFSDSVHVRNHIHAKDLTDNEKLAAWFRKPEYKTIFKNNTQIIATIEKRERELKRMMARKQREKGKKKKTRLKSLIKSIDETCSESGKDEVQNEDLCEEQDQHIIGIHRDDERGFSIRGLENETSKKRRMRDQTYLKARFAVLSVQEDVDEHMFSMQEKHEEKIARIARGTNKNKGRFGFNRHAQEEDESEDIVKIRKRIEATKEEFSIYAKAQYKNMVRMMAEKYGEICKQDSIDALERGLQDDKTVRAIDWIESEGDVSFGSVTSLGKERSDTSQDPDKRRPSTTSTAPTDISAVSAVLASEGTPSLSRMKRAKMFLWKFV